MSIRPTHEQGQQGPGGACGARAANTRLRRAWFLSAVVFLFLAACSNQTVGTWGDDAITLLVKESAASTASSNLDSQTVSGRVSIVAETNLIVTEMQFFVDDPEFAGVADEVFTEGPFEFDLDTTSLPDGEHTVSVLVTADEGGGDATRFRHANFEVKNSGEGTSTTSPVPSSFGEFSLRADPSFDESVLGSEKRLWYRRVWAAIENPDAVYSLRALSGSGNLQNYGYDFNQQMSLLIVALRATQDPALVDLIAELSDRMAGALVTDWYDYSSGSWVTPDDGTAGFRRFLFKKSSDTRFGGKDTQVLRALLSHGMIANMAYVFEANRGVSSPSGLDYGARADFWTDYLKNDFEAIWRIREGKTWPSFPLWTHQISHSFKSQMRWSFYMYKLTGEQPYLDYALEYADTVLRNSFEVDTSAGSAVVWSHKVRTPDYGLQPVSYARLDYAVEVDLALEGGLEGIDAEYMAMHARTFAHFVLDNGSADMSFDVGGMRDRTGVSLRGGVTQTVPTRDPWSGSSLEHARESMGRFAISYFTPVAVFGDAERILSVSEDVYLSRESDVENPRNLSIPVGMLLALP